MIKVVKAVEFMTLFRGEDLNEIWLVGGAVADIVRQKEPNDFDFATPKTPDEVKAILMKSGVFKRDIDMKDAKFGVVVVNFNGEQYEVTTFRKETYLPGSRKPVVEFTTDINEDANRRDFNVTCIYWNGTALYDPKRGLRYDSGYVVPHELAKRIETILPMKVSFRQDPLRVLRYIRTAVKYELDYDNSLGGELLGHIVNLSYDVIRKEMAKGFKLDGMIDVYRRLGVFDMILPFGAGNIHTTWNNEGKDNPNEIWGWVVAHVGVWGMDRDDRILLIKKTLRMMEFSNEDIAEIIGFLDFGNEKGIMI